jgi:hypothetical protein
MEMEVETARRRLSSLAQRSAHGTAQRLPGAHLGYEVGTVELKMPRGATEGTSPRSWSRVGRPRGCSLSLCRRPTSTGLTRNFTYKSAQNREPTSGLEPLSCSSYEFACGRSSPYWCVRKMRLSMRFSMIRWRRFVHSVPVRISPVAVRLQYASGPHSVPGTRPPPSPR